MTTTKIGIREFRAGLADFIDADSPIAVTRHGHTVGYFIPTKTDREADAASLRAAAAKLDALLDYDDADVDSMIGEVKEQRRKDRAR